MDGTGDLDSLPEFRCLVSHDQYSGDPVALAMNADILWELSGKKEPDQQILSHHKALQALIEFLEANLPEWAVEYTAAGKNAGGFDLPFLYNMDYNGRERLRGLVAYRVADPGPMFWDPKLDGFSMPGFRECLQRAGYEPTKLHRARGDAIDVIKLIRFKAAQLLGGK